jgi:DNA polymerase-4
VTLKLRFADFRTLTRSHTGDPTRDGLELYRRALAMLDREAVAEPVRLIGLSASGLGPGDQGQLSLLDLGAVRRDRLGPVVDRLTARFGEGSLRPASLLSRTPGRRHAPSPDSDRRDADV